MMKNLYTSILEALKTVDRGPEYDTVELANTKFRSGLSEQEIVKRLVKDIDQVFSISENELNKNDFERIFDEKVQTEINKRMKFELPYAQRTWKTEKKQNQYLDKIKAEIKTKVAKSLQPLRIHNVTCWLNEYFDITDYSFVDDMRFGDRDSYNWEGEKTVEKFIIGPLKRTHEQFLSEGLEGWKITYQAYKDTTCPINGKAILQFILTPEAEKKLRQFKKDRASSYGQAYDRFYGGQRIKD